MAKQPKTHNWIQFIGLILMLIGLYAVLRTGLNLVIFEKYPIGGVINLNFSGSPVYYQREEDCESLTYYAQDGDDKLSQEDKDKRLQNDKDSCLRTVKYDRENAKNNDISQSVLFLFLGVGVLLSRKLFS